MDFRKSFSYAVLAIIFCSIGFGGGYFLGANSVPSQAENKTSVTPSMQSYNFEPELNDETEEVKETYLLKNENNVLTLYHITDEVTSVIKSVKVNFDFLPPEDKIKLNKGIYFDNIEEGFSLIEDFTS